MSQHLILIFGILIVAGTFLSKISTRIGLPVLLVFLGVGMLAGSDVLGLIVFSDYQAASGVMPTCSMLSSTTRLSSPPSFPQKPV